MKYFLFYIFIFCIHLHLTSAITEVIQVISLKVNPITELAITPGQSQLHIGYNQALPGSSPMVSDTLSSNTYSYTIVGTSLKKITGKIDTALPSGVTLEATLQAAAGAIIISHVTLNNIQDLDLIKGIPSNSKGTNLLITYQLKSTTKAVPIQNIPLQVTLKLVDDTP